MRNFWKISGSIISEIQNWPRILGGVIQKQTQFRSLWIIHSFNIQLTPPNANQFSKISHWPGLLTLDDEWSVSLGLQILNRGASCYREDKGGGTFVSHSVFLLNDYTEHKSFYFYLLNILKKFPINFIHLSKIFWVITMVADPVLSLDLSPNKPFQKFSHHSFI